MEQPDENTEQGQETKPRLWVTQKAELVFLNLLSFLTISGLCSYIKHMSHCSDSATAVGVNTTVFFYAAQKLHLMNQWIVTKLSGCSATVLNHASELKCV